MRYPVKYFKRDWKVEEGGWDSWRKTYFHGGADINLKTGGNTDLGEPLLAIADGVVTYVGHGTTGFGNHFFVKHEGAWGTVWSHYAHCDKIFLKEGETVDEGQHIANLGNSGNSSAAHLHFEIRKKAFGINSVAKTRAELNDYLYDPIPFIEKWASVEEGDTVEPTEPDEMTKMRLERDANHNKFKEKENEFNQFIRDIIEVANPPKGTTELTDKHYALQLVKDLAEENGKILKEAKKSEKELGDKNKELVAENKEITKQFESLKIEFETLKDRFERAESDLAKQQEKKAVISWRDRLTKKILAIFERKL